MSQIRNDRPIGPIDTGAIEDAAAPAAPAQAAPSQAAAAAPAKPALAGDRFSVMAAIAAKAQGPGATAALPSWVPADLDLARVAAGAKKILTAQGEKAEDIRPGVADTVIFSDADHTLLKTTTPTYLRNKETGELLRHPGTGQILGLAEKN